MKGHIFFKREIIEKKGNVLNYYTSLILHITSLFDPHMTPGGKMKIPNPYCTSARDAQSYPSVSIVYSCKCTCSSRDNLYRKRRFTTLIWSLGIKWKFRNHIAHLQNISNHIPEYLLSILWNKDWVPVSRTSPKTSFLGLYLTHWAKMRILKPFSPYARHVQSDPKI